MSTIKLRVGNTNMEREFTVKAEPASPVADGKLGLTVEVCAAGGRVVSMSLVVDEVEQLIGVLEAGLRTARRKR